MQPTEILVKVFLPYTQKLEYVKEFKQAHRRDDDIAIANAGMRVRFKQTAEGMRHGTQLSQLVLQAAVLDHAAVACGTR